MSKSKWLVPLNGRVHYLDGVVAVAGEYDVTINADIVEQQIQIAEEWSGRQPSKDVAVRKYIRHKYMGLLQNWKWLCNESVVHTA